MAFKLIASGAFWKGKTGDKFTLSVRPYDVDADNPIGAADDDIQLNFVEYPKATDTNGDPAVVTLQDGTGPLVVSIGRTFPIPSWALVEVGDAGDVQELAIALSSEQSFDCMIYVTGA